MITLNYIPRNPPENGMFGLGCLVICHHPSICSLSSSHTKTCTPPQQCWVNTLIFFSDLRQIQCHTAFEQKSAGFNMFLQVSFCKKSLHTFLARELSVLCVTWALKVTWMKLLPTMRLLNVNICSAFIFDLRESRLQPRLVWKKDGIVVSVNRSSHCLPGGLHHAAKISNKATPAPPDFVC